MNSLVQMVSSNIHLILVGLYAYILLFMIKDDEYTSMIALTVVTVLAICYLKKPRVKEPFPSTCRQREPMTNMKPKRKRKTKEGFENAPGSTVVRQLPETMGAYDGLCLQTGNRQYWMKSPDETGLIPNDSLFSYLSSQGPEKPVFSDNSALLGPPIDGQQGSPKKMFMFANNRSSPNCCPSTYSTSTGCVCTTKNQRDFIASRGGALGEAPKPVSLE